METKTCRFCAEEIQAAAVVCKHCGNLVVEVDLETLARTWGDYSEAERRKLWDGLSVERKQSLRATIDYLTRQGGASVPGPAAAPPVVQIVQAPAKRKTSPIAWGCLVLLLVGFCTMVADNLPPPSDTTPVRSSSSAPRTSTAAPRPDTGRAADSIYNQDIRRATTSQNLSNSDIAWHALNTYGWDCEQVVSRGPARAGYFTVTCSSGKVLRVYPRAGQHPRVTNETGGYD